MLFFESMLGYAGILLFLPFFLLRRQHRASKLAVGGLEPFLTAAISGANQERKPPLSFWLFLCAYLLANSVLISAYGVSEDRVLLEDQSVSVSRAQAQAPSGYAKHVIVGSSTQSIQQADLLEEIQSLPNNSKVTVWTDLPRPHHLPAWIDWQNQAFAKQKEILGVILSAQPVSNIQWRVHWAKQEHVTASLQIGSWSSAMLIGEEGSLLIPVEEGSRRIQWVIEGKADAQGSVGKSWALPEVRIQLPAGSHLAWRAAALAAWPSADLGDGPRFALQINGQVQTLRELDDGMPWSREPVAQDVARLAEVLRASITAAHPPRDAREYLPSLPIDADRFALSATHNFARPQIAPWMVFAVLLAAVCAAIAWVKIPMQEPASYSEV